MVTTFANLESDMTQYSGPDGTQIDAYLSQPAVPGNYPGHNLTQAG